MRNFHRTIITIVLTISVVAFFYNNVRAETWKDYIKKANEARNKDKRDTMTIKSWLQKAESAAAEAEDGAGMYQVAQMYNRIDCNQEAVSCLSKAADIAESKKDGNSLLSISDFLRKLMQHREAASCVRAAERIAEDTKNKGLMASVGSAYLRLGDNSSAESCRRKAEGFSDDSDSAIKYKYSSDIRFLKTNARSMIKQDRIEDAEESLKKAFSLAEKLRDPKELREIGDLFKSINNKQYADKCFGLANSVEQSTKAATTQGKTSHPKVTSPVTTWQDEYTEGMKFISQGDKTKGYTHLETSMNLADGQKDYNALMKIGDVFKNAGNRSKAFTCYMKAKTAASTKKDPAALRAIAARFNSINAKNTADQCIRNAQTLEK